MSEHQINPEKVTKPIQLLAAWLVGMIVITGSFLVGAENITSPTWASGLLVISAVATVPVFLFSLFLLQTKFRPQMQEDVYYSKYLEWQRSDNVPSPAESKVFVEREVEQTVAELSRKFGATTGEEKSEIEEILRRGQRETLLYKHGGVRTIAELYLEPATWDAVLANYSSNQEFMREVASLIADGLVASNNENYSDLTLTDLGKEIAQLAEKEERLFSVRHKNFWKKQRKFLVES